MRYAFAVISAFALLMVATNAMAMDRDASAIDQVELRYRVYDKIDTAGVLVRGEIPLWFESDYWSIVVNAGWNRILGEEVEQSGFWHLAIGPKLNLLENTRLTVLAQGDWAGDMTESAALGGTVMLEQRLISTEASMSPYIQAACSFLNVGGAPWGEGATDDYTSWVASLVLGNDAMISETCALATRIEAWSTIHNTEEATKDWADGWAVAVGLKYYLK